MPVDLRTFVSLPKEVYHLIFFVDFLVVLKFIACKGTLTVHQTALKELLKSMFLSPMLSSMLLKSISRKSGTMFSTKVDISLKLFQYPLVATSRRLLFSRFCCCV